MKEISKQDKENGFIAAITRTRGANQRWLERSKQGLNNEELNSALRYELGICGGTTSTQNRHAISYDRAGLKIWVSWSFPNPYKDKPTFEGVETLKMARIVFNIQNPDENQFELF